MSEPRTSQEWIDRLHAIVGIPATTGNDLTVLRNGDRIFPAMLDAIDAAEDTVDIVTFVYWTGDIADRFAERLAAASRRGCRVRVLLDAVGARKMRSELFDEMNEAGCDIRWFRPIVDGPIPDIGEVHHRTHRKVLVCDRTVAFTGGVGIADEWTGDARNDDEWRDTHVAVRGPAAAGLAAAFFENWAAEHDSGLDARDERPAAFGTPGSATCMVVPGASGPGTTAIHRLITSMIQLAERRLRITTAYFNASDPVVDAICEAVDRGVEVQVLVPGTHHDKRFVQMNGEARYQALLDAGVDLRTYERSMLHAKIVTVDGTLATIGSANLNQRSMDLDEECNLVVFDRATVSTLDHHFDDDLRHSVELDPERWAERSIVQRVGEKVTAAVDRWL